MSFPFHSNIIINFVVQCIGFVASIIDLETSRAERGSISVTQDRS